MDEGSRRTRLAAERTQLAWWRTGLTAIAVGIGIGRILPALDPGAAELPFVLVGCAFAAYGIVLIAVGSARADELSRAIEVGADAPLSRRAGMLLAGGGMLLGLSVIAMIALT